jgi:hypothetical protein
VSLVTAEFTSSSASMVYRGVVGIVTTCSRTRLPAMPVKSRNRRPTAVLPLSEWCG